MNLAKDKRKEIRETVKGRLYACGCPHSLLDFEADKLLSYLHSQGVMIKVGEIKEVATTASEPETFIAQGGGIFLMSTERTAFVYKTLKEAGYVAVEPLIEGK